MGSENGNPPKALTHKQEEFARGIVRGMTQLEAYRTAYPGTKMSVKTMKEAASRLMRNSNVIATIEELKAPAIQKVQYDYERWLEEIQRVAFVDPRNFFDANGKALNLPDLNDETAPAVAGFEVSEEYMGQGESRRVKGCTKKYKLTSKLAALELYGKATGYYVEKAVAPVSALEAASTEVLLEMLAEVNARHAARQVAQGSHS